MMHLDQRQTKKCSRNLKMLNFNGIELRFLLGEKADFFAQIFECESQQDLKRTKPRWEYARADLSNTKERPRSDVALKSAR